MKRMLYLCPACGFEVFVDEPGSYDICPICNWEDDGVQLRFPGMAGGANGESLFVHQRRVLKTLPLSLVETKGYRRNEEWRPLKPAECQDMEAMPRSGREYFDSIDTEEPKYYWRK